MRSNQSLSATFRFARQIHGAVPAAVVRISVVVVCSVPANKKFSFKTNKKDPGPRPSSEGRTRAVLALDWFLRETCLFVAFQFKPFVNIPDSIATPCVSHDQK